jgi:hypothetical protein
MGDNKNHPARLVHEINMKKGIDLMEEQETLITGGKQAKEPYDYSLLPKEALHLICLNMTKGAEVYGRENYLKIPVEKNAGRAIAHLQLAEMTEEERIKYSQENRLKHLINGATRALFALDCELRGIKPF